MRRVGLGVDGGALKRDGTAIHTNRNADQRQAEENMRKAGIKPPRPCRCESPIREIDEDGVRCIRCSRWLR